MTIDPDFITTSPFTLTQGLDAGLTRRDLERGDFRKMGYNAYIAAHIPDTLVTRCKAVLLSAPNATFSHDTALTLLGLTDIIPSTIHFTIPETSRLRSRPGVTLHRSRHGAMTDRTLRDGLWVSTARRALLDSARGGADPDQLVSAARDARERALLTPADLAVLRRQAPFAGAGL